MAKKPYMVGTGGFSTLARGKSEPKPPVRRHLSPEFKGGCAAPLMLWFRRKFLSCSVLINVQHKLFVPELTCAAGLKEN